MLNRLVLLLSIFTFGYSAHAQINISFDSDCLEKNSAILAQSLINSLGYEIVTGFLENNTHFLVFSEVDSSGGVLKFKKLISNKEVSKVLSDKVKSYLIKNKKHFFICFEKPKGFNNSDAYYLIKKENFDGNNKYHLINIGFPGDLMTFYNYEKEKANEQGLTLSKYEYLLKQIKRYLSTERLIK